MTKGQNAAIAAKPPTRRNPRPPVLRKKARKVKRPLISEATDSDHFLTSTSGANWAKTMVGRSIRLIRSD